VDPENNKLAYSVSITDVNPLATAPGDAADWTFDPASEGQVVEVTLRFEWAKVGVPIIGLANTGTLRVRVPGGGADIGATVALAPAGENGSQLITLRFDDNPLDGSVGSARWGELEIFFEVARTPAVAWGPADSRGAYAAPTAGTHNDSARGYLRRTARLTGHSVSNVAIAGAEPNPWGFPDPIFSRFTFDAEAYESFSLDYEIRRTGLATVEREQTVAAIGPNRDFSWTGTAGTNRRVGNGIQLISEGKDLILNLVAADFGGDNKFVWAAANQVNWTRESDLQLKRANRITVDPRLMVAHLQQMNNRTFATPPLSLDLLQRQVTDLSFSSARFRNSRSEGQNALTVTGKNWDEAELTGSEASPVNQSTGLATDTNGGEAGWAETSLSQVPFVWDKSLPGGNWITKWIITGPVDAVGVESGASRVVTLAERGYVLDAFQLALTGVLGQK
jgi:hypothetical protein